jgi:5'-nucleotidase
MDSSPSEATRPLILVTNDDGATAPGIRALAQAMLPLGDVVVVAPDKPQSGMGHAITINAPIFVHPVRDFAQINAWACSGTPVDCVKLARDVVLHRRPDLCVSGINHGANSSINVIYSGTMSAAMEAAIEGIPAIGFSLLDYSHHADFTAASAYAARIARQVLEHGMPKGVLLNVNIPALPPEKIQGIRLCRQANAKWVEEFVERTDPRGRKYYWLTGRFENYDEGHDADETALREGYVSVVPVGFDFTAYQAMAHFQEHYAFQPAPVSEPASVSGIAASGKTKPS